MMAEIQQREDWPDVLRRLKVAGYSQDDCAQLLTAQGYRTSQPTVSRWANGLAEPSYSEGAALLRLLTSEPAPS
jgi:transcriptional regulator with XRE-family HTH domain